MGDVKLSDVAEQKKGVIIVEGKPQLEFTRGKHRPVTDAAMKDRYTVTSYGVFDTQQGASDE